METKVYDLEDCEYSRKNGLYGGSSGSKDGVVIFGQDWMVKYPKNTGKSENADLPYMATPLCEYIGSHVFSILGFRTQETILGIRKGKYTDRDGHALSCKKFLELQDRYPELRRAIPEIVPIIARKRKKVSDFIRNIPNEARARNGKVIEVCGENRKTQVKEYGRNRIRSEKHGGPGRGLRTVTFFPEISQKKLHTKRNKNHGGPRNSALFFCPKTAIPNHTLLIRILRNNQINLRRSVVLCVLTKSFGGRCRYRLPPCWR